MWRGVMALAAAALAGPPAGAAEFSLTTGVGLSTGEYESSRATTTTVVPLSARLRTGHWTFGLSTQWASVDGPADIGDLDLPAGGHAKRDRQGFTDTYVSARYALNHLGGGPFYLDLRAKAGLSVQGDGFSGARRIVDAELGADWGGTGAYVDLGRRFIGEAAAAGRGDAWAYAVGGWARFDARTELGLWCIGHEAAVAGDPGARKLGAYVSRDVGPSLRAALSLYEGLSPASPDLGAGLRLTWRPDGDFRRRPFDD